MKKALILLLAMPLLISCGSSEQASGDPTDESTTQKEHVHSFSSEWHSDKDGHYHVCECGAHDEVQPHTFGEWKETKAPTKNEYGEAQRKCSVCSFVETRQLDKYPYYRITIFHGGLLYDEIETDFDGNYALPVPEDTVGFYFAGYFDESNNPFPLTGVLTDDVKITLRTTATPFEVSSEALLDEALGSVARTFVITDDFEITKTHYVTHDVVALVDDNRTLTRAETFGGEMFVVGLDSNDNYVNTTMKIDSGEYLFTINGNSDVIYADVDNPTVVVKGAAFFVTGLSTLTLEGNVHVSSNKKTDNELMYMFNKKNDGDPEEDEEGKYPEVHQAYEIGGSAITIIGATVNLNGATFEHNAVNDKSVAEKEISSKGGVIYNNGTLNVNDAVFEGNVGSYGSVMYSARATNIKKALIRNNESYDYGTVYVNDSQYSVVSLRANELGDVTFKNNTAGSSGGAVFVSGKGTFIAEKALFESNSAASNGGAINAKGDINITDSKFITNVVAGENSKGGAIYFYYGDEEDIEQSRKATITYTTFDSNSSTNGGAIGFGNAMSSVTEETEHGPLGEIENCIFKLNNATGNGGAIYAYRKSSVSVADSIFDQNTSTDNGAAYYATQYASNTISGCSFTKNVASGNGGALYATQYSTYEVAGTEFEENQAAGGGALYLTNNATASFEHSDFVKNKATGNGGALYIYTNTVCDLNFVAGDQNEASGTGGGFAYISGAAKVSMREITSTKNKAKTGGFVYITTTASELWIYSGSSKECIATASGGIANIYSNTNKTIVHIKGTDSKDYFDYDSVMFDSKNHDQEILDIDE